MRRIIGTIGFALTVFISNSSNATSCAGFTDVSDPDPRNPALCAAVEWLKNRNITTGCGGTLYCPDDGVTRWNMALFLNRVGNALEPAFVHVTQAGAGSVVNANGVVCQTTPYAVTGYPRVATASTMFYHESAVTEQVSTRVVYSINGGAWQNFGDFFTIGANAPGKFASQTAVAKPIIFSPGQSAAFGILTGGGATIVDAGCEMTVRLDSHTGASSPYDVVP